MSILQQGDSQGELCVAYVRKESVAVSRRRICGTRRRQGFACKTHRRFWRIETERYARIEANV